MPDLDNNYKKWNNTYKWENQGDEWSSVWGSVNMHWFGSIFPRINHFLPCNDILEIAPGYGRWTNILKDYCTNLFAVDISDKCVEYCKKRFETDSNIHLFQNDGKSLNMISTNSVDFVFSYDSLVHAEIDVIESYIKEISRILRKDGIAFIHHSNRGEYHEVENNPEFKNHWRAKSVTHKLVGELAQKYGLCCISQELINWSNKSEWTIDCLSTICKTNSHFARENKIFKNGNFMIEARQWKPLSNLYDFPKIKTSVTKSIPKVQSPLVSIIIPVFNKLNLTKQCIENIFKNTEYPNYEIIIVDNGSSDGTLEYINSLKSSNSKISFIRNNSNLGFAKAINQGALSAKGEYLILLNNDTIPLNGWLNQLVETIKSNPKIGIVGAKLLYEDDSIQHCGVVLRRDRQFFKHPYKYVERNHLLVNKFRKWDAVTGACLITPTELYKKLGMLDEKYLNGCEDIDYCCKVRSADYEIFYQPKSELYHLESQTERNGQKENDISNFAHFISKWGNNALKTEHQIFCEDGLWEISQGKFIHKYDERVVEWKKQFDNAEKLNDEKTAKRLNKLFRHLYTVNEWQYEESDLPRPEDKIEFKSPNIHKIEKRYLNDNILVNKIQPKPILNNDLEVKTNNLKILFICHDFPPYRFAGAQLFAKNLAIEINKQGNSKVEILYPVFRDTSKNDYSIETKLHENILVHELHKPLVAEFGKLFDQKVYDSIVAFLEKNNFDIIHIHGLGQLTQAPVFAASKMRIKIVMTLHDFWFICSNWHLLKNNQDICIGPESIEKCALCYITDNPKIINDKHNYDITYKFNSQRKIVFADSYSKISRFYAPSNYLKTVFNQYGFDNISVLPNGLKYEKLIENQSFKYSDKKIIFGYAGQIIKRKGLNLLLEAFCRVNNPNIELHIWGKNDLKYNYGHSIKKMIDSDNRIKYFGEYQSSQVNSIFQSFDVLVVPSLMDNYPIIIQEAFINKIPIIASNTGGIPEMITNDVNGILTEVISVQSIIDAINKIIKYPELLAKYKNNIPDVKTLEINAKEYLAEYNKLLTKSEIEKPGYTIQFYIYKSVHWPMFEDFINYLKNRPEIKEIVLCLPNIPNLVVAGNYELPDKLVNSGFKIVTNPQDANADVTFIADTISGKVYDCGYIVNLGHGTISKGYYFTESVWTERENWVDLLCVPGEYARSKFQNILSTKVAATGMPKLDPVFSKQYDKSYLCKLLNLDIRKPIVLYAPTFNIDLSSVYDFENDFYKIQSNDFYVLVKLHGSTTNETIQKYRSLAQSTKNIIFIEDTNIAPYIGGADILISDVSSVFMEFMALDKPVILYDNPSCINYHGYNPNNIEYEWRDLGTRISSFTELLKVLPNIIKFRDNKSNIRKNYADNLFADLKGNASENVWNETKKLLDSGNAPKKLPVISLIVTLNDGNLPFVRNVIHKVQFYSVMAIELVIVKNGSYALNNYIKTLSGFGEFYKIKVIDYDNNKDQIIQGFKAATGDYLCYMHDSVEIHKNFEYVIYQTYKLNENAVALTGLTESDELVINYHKYLDEKNVDSLTRHAYNFINKYECKEIRQINSLKDLPKLLVIKKDALNYQQYKSYEELTAYLIKSGKLSVALSLLYYYIPDNLRLDTINVWNDRNNLTLNERLKSFSEILKYVNLSDVAEILINDLLSINFKKSDMINLAYQSIFNRYYEIEYKRNLKNNFNEVPELADYLTDSLKILDKLYNIKENDTNRLTSKNEISIPKISIDTSNKQLKILIYFFKNVHIPILIPIYQKLKELYPEVQIAFGYMSYAPQIRAGFTPVEFEILKSFGEKLYNNPQDYRPDITIIADSCYEFVQNCGLLVHIGHGLLSKGQYYTDTQLARREEYADLVCVPGEYHKNILNKIISKPVVASGMAKLDSLYNGTISRDKIIRQLKLNDKHKYILFAPTFNDELSAIPFIGDKINEVIPDNNTFLIIKLHGSTKKEYKDMYRDLYKKDARVIYVDDLDITSYIALADVMISDVSSAMMEFASLDKPLVLFNNPNWSQYRYFNPNDIEFRWRDIGIQVSNISEMKQAVVRSFALPTEFSQKRQYYTSQIIANKSNADACEIILKSAIELYENKQMKSKGN
jgi:GT2 family glycosyltransferase/CDP-glycerol glycerophosphotransferase (TagB/SpsB family)/glycosyltransferase involved in cell wall biosynthesis/ubiquinone/menaquinone biosynthesis C-methylase UbiE